MHRLATRFVVCVFLITIRISASGYSTEKYEGIGLGLDVQSAGTNPLPSIGYIYGQFAIISFQARGTASYRPSDNTVNVRGGVAAGFTLFMLNFDLTYQAGPQRSAGMFWGLSAFLSGATLLPEVFAGYQVNFSGSAENFFAAGAKMYWNFGNNSR